MWMGLEHLPTIQNYWAKKGIYSSKISKYMKVRRFELLLQTFHVSNNHECPSRDRLYKVRGLVDLLVSKYKRVYIPEESLCIDESVIPFIGRLLFRQYFNDIGMVLKYSNYVYMMGLQLNFEYMQVKKLSKGWKFLQK